MKQTSVTVGPGFCSLLFMVFLVLKLTGVIHWSWWWVTSPMWMPVALFLVVLVVAVSIAEMKGR